MIRFGSEASLATGRLFVGNGTLIRDAEVGLDLPSDGTIHVAVGGGEIVCPKCSCVHTAPAEGERIEVGETVSCTSCGAMLFEYRTE